MKPSFALKKIASQFAKLFISTEPVMPEFSALYFTEPIMSEAIWIS